MNIFNFFTRKDKVDHSMYVDMLKGIMSKLDAFQHLRIQIDQGIVINCYFKDNPIENYIKFSLDVDLLNKYEQALGRYFAICGIYVLDASSAKMTEVCIYVFHDLILGIKVSNSRSFKPNNQFINVEGVYTRYFDDDGYAYVKRMLVKGDEKLINPSEIYQIFIQGKIYYHLTDLEDGNFLAVDENDLIVEVSHDPFAINTRSQSLTQYLSAKRNAQTTKSKFAIAEKLPRSINIHFPSLSEHQFALIVSLNATGKVLSIHGKVANNDEAMYHVFDSLNDAHIFIRNRVKESDEIEFTIYDWKEKAILFLEPKEAKDF